MRDQKNNKPVNEHKTVNDETSSGGEIPLTSNSTKQSWKPFGISLNFIDSWIKSFNINYENLTDCFLCRNDWVVSENTCCPSKNRWLHKETTNVVDRYRW